MNVLRSAVFMLACLGAGGAEAAIRLVTNVSDSGTGSLRLAISGAANGDIVTFDPALNGQTITLTNGPLSLPAGIALTIQGNGATNTRVSGGNVTRILVVPAVNGSTLVLRDLTLAQGNAGNAGSGGAILNRGSLTLEGVRLTGNRAGISGGAILNERTTGVGSLVVRASALDANVIDAVECGSGAAIRSEGAGASVQVVNSTLAGNTAGPACSGGAIGIGAGSLELISSTLGPNSGGTSGGNLYKGSRAASVTVRNSVIIEGSAALNPDLHGASAGFASLGYTLVGNRGDAAGFAASDLPAGTPPMLGALAPSGVAQLPARVPMAGSALVDGVPTAACVDAGAGPLATDQRGVARPQGPACDIGAVERSFGVDDLLFANGFE